MNVIVEGGAVPALIKHLQPPPLPEHGDLKPFEHEVEKGSAFALGLLAVKVTPLQHMNYCCQTYFGFEFWILNCMPFV